MTLHRPDTLGVSLPRRLAIAATVLFTSSLAIGQTAVVERNVNLRSDPSTKNPPITLLTPAAPLTLLDPAKQQGYYHVRTNDGQEDWVWSKNISLTTVAPAPGNRIGPAEIYPDSAITLGVANPQINQDNIADNLCSKTWSTSTIRPPSSYKIKQMMEQYADTVSDANATCPLHSSSTKCYEEDHLISLENGGDPRDPKNLWPEPYNTMVNGVVMGARQKDQVEGFIHDEICFDVPSHKTNSSRPAHISITLKRGQEILTGDWYACYVSMQGGGDCK